MQERVMAQNTRDECGLLPSRPRAQRLREIRAERAALRRGLKALQKGAGTNGQGQRGRKGGTRGQATLHPKLHDESVQDRQHAKHERDTGMERLNKTMAQHASQVGKAGQLVYGTPKYDDDLVYRAIYVDAKRGRNANGTYEITSFALLPFTFDTETWVMHVQPGAAGVWRPGSDDLSTARRLAERAVAAATHNVGNKRRQMSRRHRNAAARDRGGRMGRMDAAGKRNVRASRQRTREHRVLSRWSRRARAGAFTVNIADARRVARDRRAARARGHKTAALSQHTLSGAAVLRGDGGTCRKAERET